jgi:hypothetical protein
VKPRAVFGLSVALSLLSSAVVAALLVWPRLETLGLTQALIWLVAPHMFLRFIGLSFLLPGVVSSSLPREWAVPAAYGDLAAGVFAIVATAALAAAAAWAAAAVWAFNIVGTGDLLYAFYKGARVRLEAGSLGAAFYIVTAIVPLLLATHVLIFMLLIRGE